MKKNIKHNVKYDYFSEYFKSNFKLTFGTLKIDTYQTCDRLKNLIDHETVLEIKCEFEVEKKLLIRKSEVFYNNLKTFVEKSKSNKKYLLNLRSDDIRVQH